MQLAHLASRLYGRPLLLARSKLDIILAVLGSRIGWPESNAGGIGSTLTPPMLAQSASRQELLAASPEEYLLIIQRLANDPDRLAALRQNLP